MRQRMFAAVAAVLLAAVGGVLLLGYVARADDRAMAGMQTSRVLVVTEALPQGATAEELAQAVAAKTLPAVAVAAGAVTSLEQLDGLVTTVDLQPGEQLLTSRLADPAALAAAQDVVVPEGLQQVSVQLDQQRVVGGDLTAGDTVGVFLSYKDSKVHYTKLALQKVLVTAVQGGGDSTSSESEDGPADTVTVTMAVDAAGAQKLVFAAEHGSVWLSAEQADAPTSPTRLLTQKELYS